MAAEKPKLQPLPPKPGKKLRVIGAGLPRTGTNSFCAAVSTLLDGPSYHVGVQTILAGHNESPAQKWIGLMSLWPPSTASQHQEFHDLLSHILDGYVCIADPPGSQLVPELLHLYPDAVVIATTRDRQKWAVSWAAINAQIIPFWIARVLYFWVPSVRLMPVLWPQFGKIWAARYGEARGDPASEAESRRVFDAHHAWLREVVPREKLFFVDVKDGWGPLCEALGLEVPKGVEFPRLNDANDMEELFKGFAVQGLLRWGIALGVLTVLAGGLWWWLR